MTRCQAIGWAVWVDGSYLESRGSYHGRLDGYSRLAFSSVPTDFFKSTTTRCVTATRSTFTILRVTMSESNLPDNLEFHGNGGSYPPHGVITATYHGPSVVVATWIMMCLMGLAVIARFETRHTFDTDSVAIGIACVSILFLKCPSINFLSRGKWKLTVVPLAIRNLRKRSDPSSRQLRSWKTYQEFERDELSSLQQGSKRYFLYFTAPYPMFQVKVSS